MNTIIDCINMVPVIVLTSIVLTTGVINYKYDQKHSIDPKPDPDTKKNRVKEIIRIQNNTN